MLFTLLHVKDYFKTLAQKKKQKKTNTTFFKLAYIIHKLYKVSGTIQSKNKTERATYFVKLTCNSQQTLPRFDKVLLLECQTHIKKQGQARNGTTFAEIYFLSDKRCGDVIF